MNRTVVHVSVAQDAGNCVIVALCADGTMWERSGRTDNQWILIPAVPE